MTDKTVAVKAFPNLEWSELVLLFTNDPLFKAKFNGARALWNTIVDKAGPNAPMWDPDQVAAHFQLGAKLSQLVLVLVVLVVFVTQQISESVAHGYCLQCLL